MKLPSSVTAIPGFNTLLIEKETENSSLWPVLSSIDICHPVPRLVADWTRQRTMDDGHGMARALELGCAGGIAPMEVLKK